MALRDRVGVKPVHHRSPARSRFPKLTLRSPSLSEFLGHNPEPVLGWKIARQTERSPRRQPRGVTCPAADRGGTSWIIADRPILRRSTNVEDCRYSDRLRSAGGNRRRRCARKRRPEADRRDVEGEQNSLSRLGAGGSRIRTIGPSRTTNTRMGLSTWEAKSRETRTCMGVFLSSGFLVCAGSLFGGVSR
jgi:hypothetical protein